MKNIHAFNFFVLTRRRGNKTTSSLKINMTVVRSQESIQEILDKEPEECNGKMKVPIGR